jgi:hypothetical protein
MEILFFVVVVAAVVSTWYLFNKLKAPTKPEPNLCECADAPENFVDNPVVVEKEETAAKLDEEYLPTPKPKKKAKVVKKNG